MDYKLKIQRRKVASGLTLQANLVAEDENGIGRAKATLEAPIVIQEEEVPAREYCLRRKAKIDSMLMANNDLSDLKGSISSIKIGDDPDTGTNAQLSLSVVDEEGQPVQDVDVYSYIDESDEYKIKKHPKYNGTTSSNVNIKMTFTITKNGDPDNTTEVFNKIGVLRGYTQEDVMTAIKAIPQSRMANWLWSLIRGQNTSIDGIHYNINTDLITKNTLLPSQPGQTSEQRNLGNEISKLLQNMVTDEGYPEFNFDYVTAVNVPGFSSTADTVSFTELEPSEAQNAMSTKDIIYKNGDRSSYAVGYLTSRPAQGYFSAKLGYGSSADYTFSTNTCKIRTKNIAIDNIVNNIKASVDPNWFGLGAYPNVSNEKLLNTSNDTAQGAAAEPISLTFESGAEYLVFKIPLNLKGLCYNHGITTQLVKDPENVGYSARWNANTGQLEVEGFNKNGAGNQILKFDISNNNSTGTTFENHGYFITPQEAGGEDIALYSNAVSTIIDDSMKASVRSFTQLANANYDFLWFVISKDAMLHSIEEDSLQANGGLSFCINITIKGVDSSDHTEYSNIGLYSTSFNQKVLTFNFKVPNPTASTGS